MSDSKVALVTGASRGAGAGIARGLGELGYTVYVTGRTKSPGDAKGWDGSVLPGTFEETARMVTDLGGRGVPVQCDHGDDEQVAALLAPAPAIAAWRSGSVRMATVCAAACCGSPPGMIRPAPPPANSSNHPASLATNGTPEAIASSGVTP